MAEITIHVSDSQRKCVDYMANFYRMSVSELLKCYSIGQLEQVYDEQVAEIISKRFVKNSRNDVLFKEIFDEFQ